MRNCEGALIIFYEKMSAPKKKNEDRSKLVMKNKKTGRKSNSLIHCIPQFSQVACLNILSNVGEGGKFFAQKSFTGYSTRFD